MNATSARRRLDELSMALDLLEMRNASSHTYRESPALAIYERISLRAPAFRAALVGLREQLP